MPPAPSKLPMHPTPPSWEVKKLMDDLSSTPRNTLEYRAKKALVLAEMKKNGYEFGKMRSEETLGLSKVGDSAIVEVPASARIHHPLLKKAQGGAAHVVVVGRAHGYVNGRDVAVKGL